MEILLRTDRLAAVNKPSMLLTVPGRGEGKQDSVQARARAMFPGATGPLIVHRLDWETSGVLLLALDPESHRRLGRQFEKRVVRKVYQALVAGVPNDASGEIRLPMKPDWERRPYQVVDHERGREAITGWRVLGVELRDGVECARLELRPRTGRTHQLRVHAAVGLGLPILGDRLYGDADSAERLMLHAASLEFFEPIRDGARRIRVEAPIPF